MMMTREEAIRRIKDFGLYHAIKDLPFSGRTVQAFEMAVKALEKQSEIVHCKDCENWNYPVQIEGLDGSPAGIIGVCALTGWMCGKQGYCMYGKEVE